MGTARFHAQPFDEGTLTKLQIFQLYAREWLPVFLSRPEPIWKELHVFDFFAGPGTDSNGTPGSPLRLLQELKDVRARNLHGWPKVHISPHFFDEDRAKITQLQEKAAPLISELADVTVQIEAKDFKTAFPAVRSILANRAATKLVLIDQFGVDFVSDEVFKELLSFPTCDVLFFISSSTLHRFRDHPAIRQKIRRPDDYYHVHRAVVEYYRTLLPGSQRYFLGRFSIKKGPNIYGVIFGSAHPLGMDKFLQVAWKADEMNGEADFDINRDDCGPLLSGLLPPTKINAFEADLDTRVRSGEVKSEADVIDLCFQHGVKREHAAKVLKALKASGVIAYDFRVPVIDRIKDPKPIRLLRTSS